MNKRVAAWMSGAAVGMLLGFASGMTTARVAAILVGAIAGGLLVLLGFQKAQDSADPDAQLASYRVFGFGFACTIGLALGVTARAHDWFGMTPLAAQKRWTDASFSPEQAREIVLYEKAGLIESGRAGEPAKLEEAKSPMAGEHSTLLFAAHATKCQYLYPKQYKSTDELMKSWRLHDDKRFERLADALAAVPAAQRSPLADAIYEAACGT